MSVVAPTVPSKLQAGRIARPPHLAEQVVIVDGMPGCGKTLLSAIVGALDRVEVEKYNYALEYVCALAFLGKVSDDAATASARLLTDLDLYNLASGREANFRWTDLSSVFQHVDVWRYLRRLFLPDGPAAVHRIRSERPILHLVTHNLLPICRPVAAGLGSRGCLVEVIRHPLYVLKQWFPYIERYGVDARDFTIWTEGEGGVVPWFASGWERDYLAARPMDRIIYALDALTRWGQQMMAELASTSQMRVIVIPFERFVLEPWPFLRELEHALATRVTRATRRMMRRQRVPRRMVAEGLDLSIYKSNGWEPPAQGATEASELVRRRAFAAEHASPQAMAVLDRLSTDYGAVWINRHR